MTSITSHPILPVSEGDFTSFFFEGQQIEAQKNFSIAAALHRAGFNVHSHSLTGRNRSLSCGIGKCGACEMLVDGVVKRICVTSVNDVKEVKITGVSNNICKNTNETPTHCDHSQTKTLHASHYLCSNNQDITPCDHSQTKTFYKNANETPTHCDHSQAKTLYKNTNDPPTHCDHSQAKTLHASHYPCSNNQDITPCDHSQAKTFYTRVCIIGAGPAGLAAREELNRGGIENIVLDANEKIGGQFLMQTHAFFFFEEEKRFGGMRGFDIARTLAGDNENGIMLNCSVWDILSDKKIAVKNLLTSEIFYVSCEYIIVATGAIPFMPAFKNDDLPGVYTAAVFQKMMNSEYTLLGKNILTVGAGNIGYLTSYQAIQAGAKIKAIIEATSHSGGFPVQENRIKRLGVPIITSTILLEAIPNETNTGIVGAVVATAENFTPVKGTERIVTGIDMINICTGLLPDNSLLSKGKVVFGERCLGAGDAVRIGEGTSAVLRGKQCALEILQMSGSKFNYANYLDVSKKYIEAQQHPVRVKDSATIPLLYRQKKRPFVVADCLYGFACNPCTFACQNDAITKVSTSSVPEIDYEKCTGCMACVTQCPGLALFGYDINKNKIYFPIEYFLSEKSSVILLDERGNKCGTGVVEKILIKKNKTNLAAVKVESATADLPFIRGFLTEDVVPTSTPTATSLSHLTPAPAVPASTVSTLTSVNEHEDFFLCHCDDVKLSEVLEQVGDRTVISIEEIKHLTHLGMGVCRGKRCIPRLRSVLRSKGITLTGDPLPRAPMSNAILLEEIACGSSPTASSPDNITVSTPNSHCSTTPANKTVPIFSKISQTYEAPVFIAGGGMGGSSLFRYFAEQGFKPIMANHGRGSSWRNISGGRTAFSVPELAEIASENHKIFKQLEKEHSIDYHPIRYVTFAHNEETLENLKKATKWSKAHIIQPDDFNKQISPFLNPNNPNYIAAQITEDCWQASPGKTVDYLRHKGISHGGKILENTEIIAIEKSDNQTTVFLKDGHGQSIKVTCDHFVNALGSEAEKFARMVGIEIKLYPVKHQAFITRRLPFLGVNGNPLDMLIDRRTESGFSAFYGQQLHTTGQLILCASPAVDALETSQPLNTNSQDFFNYAATSLLEWFPSLHKESFQATWAGYYTEPRYIIDPSLGLFAGLRGHGFMLSIYLAKLYVAAYKGQTTPSYFSRLSLQGDALEEKSFR